MFLCPRTIPSFEEDIKNRKTKDKQELRTTNKNEAFHQTLFIFERN